MATKVSFFKNGGVHIFGKKKSFRSANAKMGKVVQTGGASYKNATGTNAIKAAGLKTSRPAKGTYSRLPKV
jgi:hypothetical protein